MSKSAAAKTSYAIRREMRLRRDKAATAICASMVAGMTPLEVRETRTSIAVNAVQLADLLLVELDQTRPDLGLKLPTEEPS